MGMNLSSVRSVFSYTELSQTKPNFFSKNRLPKKMTINFGTVTGLDRTTMNGKYENTKRPKKTGPQFGSDQSRTNRVEL